MSESQEELRRIRIDEVDIGEENVRSQNDFGYSDDDRALISNITAIGVRVPIEVRQDKKSKRFKVISGRRRLLAAREAGLTEIPALVTEREGVEAKADSLFENLIRSDIPPLEKAALVKNLVEATAGGLRGFCRTYGLPLSTVSEWLQVLALPDELKIKITKNEITLKEALGISKLPEEKIQELAEASKTEGLLEKQMSDLGVLRRGAPRGLLTIRLVYDPHDKREKWVWDRLSELASKAGTDLTEYIRGIIVKHAEEEPLKARRKAS